VIEALKRELREILGPENVIDAGSALETLSQDFFWYSPVLKRQLTGKRADLIARPSTREAVAAVIGACSRARVPLVPRGAGTGNYGQCVPLYGGVVLDLSRFDRIHSVAGGVVRADAGARLGTIETEARAAGYELRCMPSTWMKATIGGFFCGGSGGIGSITWGGIGAADNVKSVTLLTCEDTPREIKLEETDAIKALHTYGTTGVMVEIEMRLAPKVDYVQLAFSSASWDQLLDWTDAAARRTDWRKRLVTIFEWPIPSYFAPLKKFLQPGAAVSFLLIDRAQAEAAIASAQAAGLACVYHRPLSDPPKPPFLTDYTWNHTTLWALQADPNYTYLQAGFGENFREQFAALRERFPEEIFFHLEWTAGNAKMGRVHGPTHRPDTVFVGGLPLVSFRSEARLQEIIAACGELGVFIANPHVFALEDGGRHPNIAEKRALKTEVDPHALLNPGKMKSYPINPFAAAAL